ncbi:uncharacterized protein LOC134281365 [Saccostrea cucullata]|uniref:uncharacterized protein LOC134281365 n=1 Tax=Saccostrea cuccullata TaxID=36930 RepID=UPI002ED33DA5
MRLLTWVVILFSVATKGLENLSQLDTFRGIASQSSSYYSTSRYNADKAVDGILEDAGGEETCSITVGNHGEEEAWWKLPFKQMSNVAYLEIYFRSSTVNRHVGFSVFVFNNSAYIPPSNPSQHKVFTHNPSKCLERVTNVTINKVTQGIALYNPKEPTSRTVCRGFEPNFATIEVCEVNVMGCPSKHYGDNCTLCDVKCRDRQCDAFNGSCIYGCSETVTETPYCSGKRHVFLIICICNVWVIRERVNLRLR